MLLMMHVCRHLPTVALVFAVLAVSGCLGQETQQPAGVVITDETVEQHIASDSRYQAFRNQYGGEFIQTPVTPQRVTPREFRHFLVDRDIEESSDIPVYDSMLPQAFEPCAQSIEGDAYVALYSGELWSEEQDKPDNLYYARLAVMVEAATGETCMVKCLEPTYSREGETCTYLEEQKQP